MSYDELCSHLAENLMRHYSKRKSREGNECLIENLNLKRLEGSDGEGDGSSKSGCTKSN